MENKQQINPEKNVNVLEAYGIDLTQQSPKLLSDNMINDSEKTINMGCMDKESCPALFVNDVLDWNIEDPKEKTIEQVRLIRDDIKSKVLQFIESLKEKN